MTWKSVLFYIAVLMLALGLNSTFAKENRVLPAGVPVMGEDGWILPVNDDSVRRGSGLAPAAMQTYSTGSYGGGVEQWRPQVEGACGGDPSCVNWMLTTISCESGGYHGAVGYYGEVGILQFRPDGLWGAVYDAGTQIAIAADAYYSGLRHHWTCSPW